MLCAGVIDGSCLVLVVGSTCGSILMLLAFNCSCSTCNKQKLYLAYSLFESSSHFELFLKTRKPLVADR